MTHQSCPGSCVRAALLPGIFRVMTDLLSPRSAFSLFRYR